MILTDRLKSLLAACDDAAVENVRAGKGGPFAASLHIYDQAEDEWITLAGPVGNAVLETGLASAHAEDRIITPDSVSRLKMCLGARPGSQIYAVSSAESCPACHAKLEILARDLIRERLIAPGAFTVAYGATYEDTESIAGFNDAPYHNDFQLPPGTGLIRQETMAVAAVPDAVRVEFETCLGRCAAVVLEDRIYKGEGAKPEVSAIQAACHARKEYGINDSWDLKRATLYTWTRDIGPLAYAEAQWANIGRWVTVLHGNAAHAQTIESEGIKNGDLFRVIGARPYTHPDSALRFLHVTPFENRGQQEWRLLCESGNVRIYNGAG